MKRSYWYWILFISVALAASHWRSFAAELEYIPLQKKIELRQAFAHSKRLSFASGQWLCDMYGVGSGLQTLKSVHLYNFEQRKDGIYNRGAQGKTVSVYKFKAGDLEGKGVYVNDRIRQSSQGQLISELSHDGDVVAYSRCHIE
jgi:hypothetical protein